MQQIIERYSEIISDYKIIAWDSEAAGFCFKAVISFFDDSSLIVKDYLFAEGRKYAYHWQSSDGKRTIRWDNAPHWKEIDTYPHHRHEDSEVFSSTEVTLEGVLTYLFGIIK